MNYAQGELILGMDDDMQNHPSQIHSSLTKWKKAMILCSECLNRGSFPGLKISQGQ